MNVKPDLLAKQEFVEDFKKRTKEFVLRSVHVFQALPKSEEAQILGKQFLRSASSTGANYELPAGQEAKQNFMLN